MAMRSTSDKTFVDSSVLIYAHNRDAGAKREIARGILDDLWCARRSVLIMQVLQEAYVNVTRKIAAPLSKNWCAETTVAEIAAAFSKWERTSPNGIPSSGNPKN
jgi:predicted nucleic acid-binding protein